MFLAAAGGSLLLWASVRVVGFAIDPSTCSWDVLVRVPDQCGGFSSAEDVTAGRAATMEQAESAPAADSSGPREHLRSGTEKRCAVMYAGTFGW